MPPKIKVTRQMILGASFQIIREQGHENLSARTIAEQLNCSTQPVLYNFRTIDEIREDVYRFVDQYHTAFILPKEGQADDPAAPLLSMGLAYVRFGSEERNLFRFLFQTDKFGGMDINNLLDNPDLAEVIDVVSGGMGVSREEAREMFLTFFCVAHGLASLLANNSMAYDEQQATRVLESVFYGVAARKGKKDA